MERKESEMTRYLLLLLGTIGSVFPDAPFPFAARCRSYGAEEASSECFLVTDRVDYGNVGGLQVEETTDTLKVGFMPHPHGGIESLWFCFRVERTEPSPISELEIRLANTDTTLGGGNPERMCPVFREAGGDWERLDPGRLIEHPDARMDAVWKLPAPDKEVDIAACYPYGLPEVEELVEDSGGFYRLDRIGLSQEGRPLMRLSNDPGSEGGDRLGIYITARQHAGETPGSWVLDGLLRFFASRKDDAPLIWCVPLANIDSIEQGDYGKDPFPHDLNRAWGSPPMRHETLVFQRDARKWSKRCKPILFLDLHAPGYSETAGFYAFGFETKEPGDRESEDQERWCSAFEEALGDQVTDPFLRVARYTSRWAGTEENPVAAAGFFRKEIGVTSLSIECTYCFAGEKRYAREDYREAGEQLGRVILDLLNE
jgi:hypothetical protein